MADPTFPVGQVIPTADRTFHDEDTLFKVQAAITGLGYSGQPVLDIIAAMQNKGILFRERLPEGWLDKGPEPTETDPGLMPRVSQAWHDHPQRISIAARMRADADEAEAFEQEEERQREADDIKITLAEEPVEHRLIRAHLNGYAEGVQRASWGVPWDHS